LPCPVGIDIPHVFNAYTYHNVYGLSVQAKKMWDEKRGASVSECTGCGACAEKCPQHIKIPGKLKDVDGVLSELPGES